METICHVCVAHGGLLSDRCESCDDFSRFVPDIKSGRKPEVIGIADTRGLTGNGKLSLLLWLAQRREP